MNFINMLTWWQWAALAAVPPAIVVLYFLKLKRQPLEVPSTYLWHKSIEDLTVNSLWQRLRRNLLLLLQLLVLAALIAAAFRPGWQSKALVGGRYIFLIDTSASMSASDVSPNRLEESRRRIGQLLDSMQSGDAAMLISFSDVAKVEQSFTDNVQELRRALAAVQPTQRSTSLDEALRLAAGLANPGKSEDSLNDQQVAEPLPAKLYIFSDGRFPDVRGFSLGNLEPVFVPIGEPAAANVGIVSFTVRRNDQRPDQMQAFVRLENHSDANRTATVELRFDGRLIDARDVKIAADGTTSEAFSLESVDEGVLHVSLKPADQLAADNEAWAVVSAVRRARVLLVTPGNGPLRRALTVGSAQQWAEVREEPPAFLKSEEYRKLAAGGSFDLVIYDRCQPEALPQANTFFIGTLPPVEKGGRHLADASKVGPDPAGTRSQSPASTWSADPTVVQPQIIDTNREHPIMQFVELGDVDVLEARPLHPPPGSTRLIESSKGPLLAIAPREAFEDAVLGFELVHTDAEGANYANTTWQIKLSFPVFVSNLIQYFGGNRQGSALESVRPGQPVSLRLDAAGPLTVRKPDGTMVDAARGRDSALNFSATDELGVYEVRAGGKTVQRWAVNLLDSQESEIRPRPEGSVKIGYTDVKGQDRWESGRREMWRYLLIAALAVLLLEWYIYNRRVYL